MDLSRKDFTNMILTDMDIDQSEIVASCFSQDYPDTEVFPPNMTGKTFVNCNLDNVKIPPGNEIIGGSNRRLIVTEDGILWSVDENNNPIERV